LVSDGPIIALSLLVLDRLPSGWDRALYLAGGLFTLYLALGAFRGWLAATPDVQPNTTDATARGVLRAAIANALSPGPYLFWGLVTGPILLEGWRAEPSHGLAFLLGFYAAMVLALALLIMVFDLARRAGPRLQRALVGLSALALAVFGVHQIVRAVG
jgi:threonine/homoserine/homoserine lactone efflux protein